VPRSTDAQSGRAIRRGLYEIDATKEIYGPADDSFLEELIRIAGGDPITTGNAAVFEISLERLVQADPEVLLLGDAAYGVTAGQVASRPGWGGMTAVETGAMRPIDDIVVTRPGPRLVAGLRALALAIDPTAVLPSAAP
jgi:iron complex transport system substrate-binding protein